MTTFAIAYNDGDKEDGTLPANVRRVGPSTSESVRAEEARMSGGAARPGSLRLDSSPHVSPSRGSKPAIDAEGKALAVGDRIEAKPHGRGSRYMPGAVSAIHVNPTTGLTTFGIDYDDGTVEDNALSADVYRVGATHAVAVVAPLRGGATPKLEAHGKDADGKMLVVGDSCECLYKV